MSNIFREIKRVASQFFEREYWYSKRKVTHLWYDEDDSKWKDSSYPKNAKTVMNSTWEGETDIWYTVLLKLDHMFWNLRKYGVEKEWYIYSSDIQTYGTKEDKAFLTSKVVETAFREERKFKNIFLANADISKDLSDNSVIGFFLKYDEPHHTMYLTGKTNKLIPQDKIPKKKKFYTLESYKDENGKIIFESVLADQYETMKEYVIDSVVNEDVHECERVLSLRFERSMQDFLKQYDVKNFSAGSLNDLILDRIDEIGVNYSVADRLRLSKELKAHAIGNFVKCRDILHLRHLIKNLLKISNDDMKYDYMWVDIKDYNQRLLAMKEARVHYNADRKEAYHKVADFMCEKALRWWD